jgi:hypothetical protein
LRQKIVVPFLEVQSAGVGVETEGGKLVASNQKVAEMAEIAESRSVKLVFC